MKGGRTAPRNSASQLAKRHQSSPFNEGGADCPPKLFFVCEVLAVSGPSMKGGRTAPRNIGGLCDGDIKHYPSMKGGRTAPRNSSCR